MPSVPYLESIAAIAGQSGTAEHFSYGFRDFLDGFYENPHGSKLAEEPRRLTQILKDEGYADAYLAALAEHLAGQFRLPFRLGLEIRREVYGNLNLPSRPRKGDLFVGGEPDGFSCPQYFHLRRRPDSRLSSKRAHFSL